MILIPTENFLGVKNEGQGHRAPTVTEMEVCLFLLIAAGKALNISLKLS